MPLQTVLPVLAKSIRSPQKAINRLSYYGTKAIGSSNFTKFIVLTKARSGSNLLLSLLDCHSNVYVRGEEFKDVTPATYKNVWDFHWAKQPYFIKAAGLKIFYDHPQTGDCPKLWDDLIADRSIKVIHLIRKNSLQAFLSLQLAKKNDVWYLKQSDRKTNYDPGTITIDPDALLNAHNQALENQQKFDDLFRDHAIQHLYYEDLANNQLETVHKATEFLNLPLHKPHTDEKKAVTKPIRDVIKNYDELKTHFSGTELESFFDE